MNASQDDLLRAVSRSLCVRFGTTEPFAIGRVSAERVGYAQIPSVVVTVVCRDESLSALVPIVRQRVFAELAERGWGDEHIVNLTPGTMRGRRRKFVDENESSPTVGRSKFGIEYRFRFDMSRDLAAATFPRGGSFARLPEEPGRQAASGGGGSR